MASRRSRLQIKPNLGPKAKAGPSKPTPGSATKSETASDGTAVKGKPRPTLSLSGVQSGTKEGPLSPRKNVLLSPTKQAISSPVKSHPPKSPLKDKNVSLSKNTSIQHEEQQGGEVKSAKETPKATKEADCIDGRSGENRAENIGTKSGDGRESSVETAKGGPALISRKRKFQPNLNTVRKPTGEGDEGSKVKAPGSPVKSVRFNVVSADKKVLDSSDKKINENKDSDPKKKEEVKETEESAESKKEKQKKFTVVKSRFSQDAPLDRTKMKMSDLVFWNPNRNYMKKKTPHKPKLSATDVCDGKDKNTSQSADTKNRDDSITPNPILMGSREESRVDDPDMEGEEDETPMPVPQVKIGPDGNLIINEESLVIKNKEKSIEETNTEIIDETDSFTTYQSFRKKKNRKLWTEKQTEKFYKALQCIGTDFTLMEKIFPKRSRHDIKNKFMKEDRENRHKIERALEDKLPFDLSLFDNDNDNEDEDNKKKKKSKRETKPKKMKRKGDTESELLLSYLETSSKSTTVDTQPKKRPRRANKKPKSYYVQSDDEIAEEEEAEKKEEDEKQVIIKKNKSTRDEQSKSTPVVLEQSNVSNVAGSEQDNGPLILVYNKAPDGGDTVIHVYRLQPDMLPSISSAAVGDPVTINVNADPETTTAPPSGNTQNVNILGSSIASQNVKELPRDLDFDLDSDIIMRTANTSIVVQEIQKNEGPALSTTITSTSNVVPSEQYLLSEKSNSLISNNNVEQHAKQVLADGVQSELVSVTPKSTIASNNPGDKRLSPNPAPQSFISMGKNLYSSGSSNTPRLIPYKKYKEHKDGVSAGKHNTPQPNVLSTSSTKDNNRQQIISSHATSPSEESKECNTSVTVEVEKSSNVVVETNTDGRNNVDITQTNNQLSLQPTALRNSLDSPIPESQIVYLPTNENSGQFGFFVPLPLENAPTVTPVLNQVTGVRALPEGITIEHEGNESSEVGIENVMVVDHNTGPGDGDYVAIDINFTRENFPGSDNGNGSDR